VKILLKESKNKLKGEKEITYDALLVYQKVRPSFGYQNKHGVNMLQNRLLENRTTNITTQLVCYSPELAKDIFKTFEDFRLVAQIREEIE